MNCRCWQDGHARRPPFDPALLVFTGGLVDIAPEHADDGRLYAAYWEWRRDACPHVNMEHASEAIANWPDYRAFTAALARAGDFSTLTSELPRGNSGTTPAAAAATALEELAVSPSGHEPTVAALIRVFRASRETGNPVVWL
ncbi:hypothetical protein EV193_10557 [Herbihabitans rhizosphaerae]|uniref:Uncharacterized protein n=1 Tax=Herbihabitans rhizosphaerae TaxID=1872711 RepID=A0A4Q7KQC0_9PSEU|nr:hypothetical protein EV193_10557 [Herbihabitans rhizosphaerae]